MICGLESLEERRCEVLGGWNPALEPRHVGVEVVVIDVLDDFGLDDVGELLEIDDVADALVHVARDDHLELVAMAVKIDALAVQGTVLFRRELRIAQLVRGIERFTPADAKGGTSGAHRASSVAGRSRRVWLTAGVRPVDIGA